MRVLLPVALALALSACAGRPFIPEAEWQAGARAATIEGVDTPGSPLAVPDACSAAVGSARAAGRQIVAVHYRLHRAQRHMLAVAEAGTPLAIGAWVELWPADCREGQLGRVVPLNGSPQP
ncbi:MAG TPA: hypothetical protein VGF27_00905 [Pseudoduganella sp.]